LKEDIEQLKFFTLAALAAISSMLLYWAVIAFLEVLRQWNQN